MCAEVNVFVCSCRDGIPDILVSLFGRSPTLSKTVALQPGQLALVHSIVSDRLPHKGDCLRMKEWNEIRLWLHFPKVLETVNNGFSTQDLSLIGV